MVERPRELYALGRPELQADGGADADCAFKRGAMADIETGYRTDLGGASNAPRVDAREEGGLSARSERLPENRPRTEAGAKPGKTVGRQPAWNGRFSQGWPETLVNTGLADRLPGTPVNSGLAGRGSGDARFTRDSGQVW